MTRKELNEIKSQYTLEDCGILRLCGCYVDGERNKITQFNENFLNLPEEEKHKYFDIFKKTLSGTPGKNLVDMKFNVDAYADEGARTFLMNLRDSGLKDDRLLNEFYDRIINNYSYVGNYLILLINQVYDIPAAISKCSSKFSSFSSLTPLFSNRSFISVLSSITGAGLSCFFSSIICSRFS